ncbi:MAG: iron-sulfur cluster assembly protein [Caldisericia bacterium]|nr:iron-sulfur cluster assembly protein [Caldisericia bacterium]
MNEKVIEIIKKIKDPETQESIYNLGLVTGFTIEDDSIDLFMDFISRTNACFFCKIIAWDLINKISEDLINELKNIGFQRVRLIDYINPQIEYKTYP